MVHWNAEAACHQRQADTAANEAGADHYPALPRECCDLSNLDRPTAVQQGHPDALPLPRVGVFEELDFSIALEKAIALIMEQKYEAALKLLDCLIGAAEADGLAPSAQRDDGKPHAFRNTFEEALLHLIHGPQYPVVPVPVELFGAYCFHGYLLFELKRYEEAERSLNKAAALNPVNCEPVAELAEICKLRGDWDGLLAHTNRAFEMAYDSESLARCYRNYGYYHIEQKNYGLATALFIHSLAFDPESIIAVNELAYIQEQTGQPVQEPVKAEILALLEANGIPLGASNLVTTAAKAIGQEMLAQGRYEDAFLCCYILCDVGRG